MAKAAPAFKKLAELAAVCHKKAHALPSSQETQCIWTGIGITLRNKKYVCPLGEVAEILKVPSYTKIPGVGGWVNGVANVRGRLLAVLDMSLFFYGESAAQAQSRRRVLVLEQGEMYSGLIVNQVLGMQHFVEDSFQHECSTVEQAIAPFVEGSYEKDGEVWPVLHPSRLISDERFMKLAG